MGTHPGRQEGAGGGGFACNTRLSPGQGFPSLFLEDAGARAVFLLKHQSVGSITGSFAGRRSRMARIGKLAPFPVF